MGVNSLPKTVTRQRRDCDLNPGPSAPESSTLTTRLPSHPRSSQVKSIPFSSRAVNEALQLARAAARTRQSGENNRRINIDTMIDVDLVVCR